MGAVKRRRWQRKWEGWKENNRIGNKDREEQTRGDVIMKISGGKGGKQRGWVEETKRRRDKELGDKVEEKNRGIIGAEQSGERRKESADMDTQVRARQVVRGAWGRRETGTEGRKGEREMEGRKGERERDGGEEKETGSPRRRRSRGDEISCSTLAAAHPLPAFQQSSPSARRTPATPPLTLLLLLPLPSCTPLHFGYQSIQLNLNSRIFNLLRLSGGSVRAEATCCSSRPRERTPRESDHIFFFFSGGGCSSFFGSWGKVNIFIFAAAVKVLLFFFMTSISLKCREGKNPHLSCITESQLGGHCSRRLNVYLGCDQTLAGLCE